MTTILKVKLGYPTASTPTRSKEQWKDGLQINAPRIYGKLMDTIPDEGKFSERIADPSSERYKKVITEITPSTLRPLTENMIYDNQRSNLVRAYKGWKDSVDHAFETVDTVEAKRFKDAVAAKMEAMAKGLADRTLRAVGTKLEGRGAAIIAPFWLTAHPDASSLIRAGTDEILIGNPFSVVVDGTGKLFISALTQSLTLALIQAQKSEMAATEVAALNDYLNHLCQSFVDPVKGITPFATGGLSHCDIVDDPVKGEMLEVQVDKI